MAFLTVASTLMTVTVVRIMTVLRSNSLLRIYAMGKLQRSSQKTCHVLGEITLKREHISRYSFRTTMCATLQSMTEWTP